LHGWAPFVQSIKLDAENTCTFIGIFHKNLQKLPSEDKCPYLILIPLLIKGRIRNKKAGRA
jgi:hypothetical protein